RMTVLRDGRKVTTVATADLRQADLVRLMVGHEVRERVPLPAPAGAPPLLEARLTGNPPRLEVRGGEILGFAGLVGAGRSRLGRSLAGLDPIDLRLDGRPVRLRSPADALAHGIAYLTEDRKREGLFDNLSVLVNATAAALPSLSRFGVVRLAVERRAGAAILERLRLVARSLAAPVRELSGGNQQKVIFGRALLCRPRILVCDEPTRGVDVGAKDEIYDLLLELARQGVAIVLISSELKEVLALSHRVLVMRDGGLLHRRPSRDARRAGERPRDRAARGGRPTPSPAPGSRARHHRGRSLLRRPGPPLARQRSARPLPQGPSLRRRAPMVCRWRYGARSRHPARAHRYDDLLRLDLS